MYIDLAEKSDTSITHNEVVIVKTLFFSNIAGIGGGGLVMFYPALKVIDCNITNNSAIAGGGIFVHSPLDRKQIDHAL